MSHIAKFKSPHVTEVGGTLPSMPLRAEMTVTCLQYTVSPIFFFEGIEYIASLLSKPIKLNVTLIS